MSSGTWKTGKEKVRTGLYNRFVSLANSRLDSTRNGIVGIMVRSDWGPDNELTICSEVEEIYEKFGTGGTVKYAVRAMTAEKKYKPRKIIIYRMTTANAKCASAAFNDSIDFKAKYTGIRGNGFKIQVQSNVTDQTKVNVCVYEGSSMISKYTVAPADLDKLVELVNSDEEGVLKAEKIGDTALQESFMLTLVGGTSGDEVTSANYVAALTAFESAYINTLALDGVTDPDIITLVKSWHERVWTGGKLVMLVVGGSKDDDAEPKLGNNRSKKFDSYGVVNCIVGGIDSAGNRYSSAEMAPQIAGAIAAMPLNKSLTYKELDDIVDVTVVLSDTEIEEAIRAGSFVLFRDIDPEDFSVTIKVEKAINTFTSFTKDKGNKLRKIKAIATMSAIDYDTGRYAMQKVLGELDNTADGRAALFSGIANYLETLAAQNVISKDILVGLSDAYESTDDVVYMETRAYSIDKIEQIFNEVEL